MPAAPLTASTDDGAGGGSTGQLLDQAEFVIIPLLNVDGYEFTWTDDRLWRKNRRPPPSGSACYGIDLNRNYDVSHRHVRRRMTITRRLTRDPGGGEGSVGRATSGSLVAGGVVSESVLEQLPWHRAGIRARGGSRIAHTYLAPQGGGAARARVRD